MHFPFLHKRKRVRKPSAVVAAVSGHAVDKARYDGTLIARGLTKAYRERRVVNGVSLVVGRGEAVGLLGPNGAGKTTYFYMITGLVPVDEGSIEINGNDVTTMPMLPPFRRSISSVSSYGSRPIDCA